MLRRVGLEEVSISMTGGGHYSVEVEAPSGATKRFTMASTPGDFRADRNNEAALKRFWRENPAAFPPASTPAPTPTQTPVPTPPPAPPAIIMTTEPTKQPKTRNSIGHAEFFKLCEWTKTADLTNCHTKVEMARRATAGLGITVSENACLTALEATGITLAPPPAALTTDRVRIVARELAKLMQKFGEVVPDDMRAVVNGVKP